MADNCNFTQFLIVNTVHTHLYTLAFLSLKPYFRGTSSGTLPAMNELDSCVMVRRAVYTSKPDVTILCETLFILLLSPIHSTFHSADPKLFVFRILQIILRSAR